MIHTFTAALMFLAEVSLNGIAAAIAIALTGVGAAIAMGIAISKAVDSIARQPEADNKIRGALMVGLAFIETLAIYSLLVAILLIVL